MCSEALTPGSFVTAGGAVLTTTTVGGVTTTTAATLSFGATVAMGVAAGAVGGFANAYGMTTLAGKSQKEALRFGANAAWKGALIGGAVAVAGYGIGKGISSSNSKNGVGGNGGATEISATACENCGVSSAPKVNGATWVDKVGYVFDDVVVKGSAIFLTVTRVGVTLSSVAVAGMLSIITAIPGDTPNRLIEKQRAGFEKSKGNNSKNDEIDQAAKDYNVDRNKLREKLHDYKRKNKMKPGENLTEEEIIDIVNDIKFKW